MSSVPTEWQGLTLVTNDFLCVCSPEVIGKNPSFEALNSNKSAVVITKHGHFTMVLLAGLVAMLVACNALWPGSHLDVTSEGHSCTTGVCTHVELVVHWEELPFCKGVV